jgi:hypothetical protein
MKMLLRTRTFVVFVAKMIACGVAPLWTLLSR